MHTWCCSSTISKQHDQNISFQGPFGDYNINRKNSVYAFSYIEVRLLQAHSDNCSKRSHNVCISFMHYNENHP